MTALPDRPLSRAREEADAIRATAEAEIAAARAEGHAEGRAQGESEAAALLLTTQTEVTTYLNAIEPRLADLATQIVRSLLDGMDDAELIASATRRALQGFRAEEAITLSVPVPLVDEVEARLDGTLRVVGDRLLTGRQCILTSAASSIDITLDAQLQALREAMVP